MKLKISGFKAHNHALRLDPLMVISASNGAGKSAVVESLRYLALGYVPGLGKRPQDSAALLRGTTMKVSLELAEGRTLWRRLDRTPKGYRSQARCSWVDTELSSVNSEEILRLFGRDEQEVAESLDIRQLLAASPMQREARIAALLAATAGGLRETMTETLDLARGRGASSTVLESAAPALESALREGLDAALEWSNAEKRRLAAEIQGKVHAGRELEDRLAELPRVNADELRDLEREAAELEARAAEIRRHAALVGAADADVARAEDRERAAREDRRVFEASAQERGGLRKELAAIDREMDAMLIPPQEDPEESGRMIRAARDLEAEARSIPEPAVEDAASLEPSPWSEVATISKRLLDLAREEHTPLGYRILEEAQRLDQLARAALRIGESARLEREQRLERERQALARREGLLSRAARMRAEAEDLVKAARTSYIAAHGEAIRKRRELAARRAGVRQQLAQIEAGDRTTALALERAVVELDVRRRQREDLLHHAPEPEDPKRLAALRREIDELAQARAARTELERALSEHALAEERRTAYAAIEWALQRVRERRLDESGDPLVQGMTRILRAGGRRETPFLEAAGGACRIGWRTPGGQAVLIQALSGGEWTLFAAALAASLILLRAPALRFLLVEAGEADARTLQSLLAGLRSVGGSFTSVMVLTHLPVTAQGWTVVAHLPSLQAESA